VAGTNADAVGGSSRVHDSASIDLPTFIEATLRGGDGEEGVRVMALNNDVVTVITPGKSTFITPREEQE
jgi:hypothetical protein